MTSRSSISSSSLGTSAAHRPAAWPQAALRGVLFVLLVLAGQMALSLAFPADAPPRALLADRFIAAGTEIIFFGDSSVITSSTLDEDKRPTSAILASHLVRDRVGLVAAAAFQVEVYAEFARYIVRQGGRPNVVIVPINLRSFSPEWDRRPQYQFELEKLYLRLAPNPWLLSLYRPATIFTDLEPISQAEYLNSPVFNGTQPVGRVWDFDNGSYGREANLDANIKNKLLFHYLYALQPQHRKLRSLLSIIDTLQGAGIQPVVYITPIDYQTGEHYYGELFSERLTENVALIQRLLSTRGTVALDLSRSAGAGDFNWGPAPKDGSLYPNEHLQDSGRQLVAEQLYHYLQQPGPGMGPLSE